ncbi:MAG: pantoate--beta-alanine ligase [Gammaproteobacteria bacterium]|mgnify:CR=1 FL=1|nr:pantoate--beta-alanine ligase [Gammaproteobacteria bacterium]MBT4462663.1 pantoate--beta-alanine ligase [Gammaproteobacteria bacterium]MBT4654910.1 pantoate--beta-alanine ligase [Gammaproteobacteria bacterium]MBT5116590.1 pantoate--beta-alanine ligase [Gammaproteobacteria bacterium]MBT5761783.1 pantoate--beta-alanine ligase [Gammaproteobacteria bacterium]
MKIITSIEEQKEYCSSIEAEGNNISLIPTMGNLHSGHESLLLLSRSTKNKRIVSLFVNPLQFDSISDYRSYPSSIDSDIEILERNKVDCLFMPDENQMIENINHPETIHLPQYMSILCGKHRKGHFDGVFKIVKKLFKIINPSIAYFGKKDYQQLMMVRHIAKEYFGNRIEIVAGDTVRESNGLAMSSRNNRLSLTDKKIASSVHKELIIMRESINLGSNNQELLKKSIDALSDKYIKIEYLELLSSVDFSIISKKNADNAMLFVAFYISGVRLIDNIDV